MARLVEVQLQSQSCAERTLLFISVSKTNSCSKKVSFYRAEGREKTHSTDIISIGET